MIAAPIDTLLVNAAIRTMDPGRPQAEALAIAGGRIRAVGTNAEMRALAGGRAREIDAEGRPALPGFHDTHIHLLHGGYAHSRQLRLDGCATVAAVQEKLRAYVAERPNQEWILGGGWNSSAIGERGIDAAALDAVEAERPVVLFDCNLHSAIANTEALRRLGIGPDTPDPANGVILRGPDGAATGMLHETAAYAAWEVAPQPTPADYAEGLLWAQAKLHARGITGVLDPAVEDWHMRVYRSVEDAGRLRLRVGASATVQPEESVAAALERLEALRRDHASAQVRMHSAKFFVDGVMESRTATMLDDYADAEGGNREPIFAPEHLRAMAVAFDAARFQIHAHCIGDGATRITLDALEAARRANGVWPSLHQIAHLQFVHPDDIARLGPLGVIANIQPLWAAPDAGTACAAAMAQPEMRRWQYPFRALADAGAPLALSSDWSVSSFDPFWILASAVTRRAHWRGVEATDVFSPEQRLDVATAVRGYTDVAAAAAWRTGECGVLAPGHAADVIVLDRDLLSVEPDAIADTRVLMTLVDGAVVHTA